MSEGKAAGNGGKIEEFRKQVIAHANFLRGRGGEKMHLRATELTRVVIENFSFSDATISGCSFTFSSFARSNFSGAKLSNSRFAHCNLTNCEFVKTEMRALSIQHSNLAESKMASVRGAEAFFTFNDQGEYSVDFKSGGGKSFSTNFSNSNFTGADLSNAILPGGKFSGANMEGANFNGADLSGADFTDANLVGISLEGAKLENVKFDGAVFSLDDKSRKALAGLAAFQAFAKGQDHIQSILKNHEAWALSTGNEGIKAQFASKVIKGADFRYRTLSAIDFSDTEIRASLFTEAVIAASNFSKARASYCNFNNIDGRGIRFDGATFDFCSFVDADFSPLIIKRNAGAAIASNFRGTVFTNCDLTRAKLTPELLRQAKFVNCRRDATASSPE